MIKKINSFVMNNSSKIIISVLIIYIIYNYLDSIGFFDYDQINLDREIDFSYPMYCIYMPERKDYINNFFNKYDLNVNMIKGVDKNTIDLESLLKKGSIKKWKKMNTGRVACHYSHLNILKKFLQTDEERCIIFEDDLISNYKKYQLIDNLNKLMNNLPIDCGIFYIGYCWENCDKTIRINEYYSESSFPLCRHAYSVNREAANKIINNTSIMYDNGDRMIANLIKNKKFKSYLSNYPNLFNQNRENLGSFLGNGKNNICRTGDI